MQLGKVIGNVVAVQKEKNLIGLKLLVVDYLDEKLQSIGKSAVCTDTVSAGPGDVVMLCSSSSARLTKLTKDVCTDNSIVGIVDSISSSSSTFYKKGIGE
ncbi:MAG: EutN/CcmL family microcompartment protein [Melioribacteraceae bacterium]